MEYTMSSDDKMEYKTADLSNERNTNIYEDPWLFDKNTFSDCSEHYEEIEDIPVYVLCVEKTDQSAAAENSTHIQEELSSIHVYDNHSAETSSCKASTTRMGHRKFKVMTGGIMTATVAAILTAVLYTVQSGVYSIHEGYNNGSIVESSENSTFGYGGNSFDVVVTDSDTTAATVLDLKSDKTCIFGSGPWCLFPCMCGKYTFHYSHKTEKSEACNTLNGSCSSRSCKKIQKPMYVHDGQLDFKWHGNGCQIGNAALTAVASQSGRQDGASRGIDGHIGHLPKWLGAKLDSSKCVSIKMPGRKTVWYELDLQQVHEVKEVILYSLYQSASESVHIIGLRIKYKVNKTGIYQRLVCKSTETARLISSGSRRVPRKATLEYHCPFRARYVRIFKKSTLTLCEMVVVGHRYYNVDCSKCSPGRCHENMWCEQCVSGWETPLCTKPI